MKKYIIKRDSCDFSFFKHKKQIGHLFGEDKLNILFDL